MFRLLIADDEPMIVSGLETCAMRAFPDAWEWIHTAKDGNEALELVEKEQPDILITDIKMPGMTGIEVLTTLREKNNQIRTIVLSGYNDFEYVRAAAVLGIENYLLKPVNVEELSQTLNRTMEKIRREEENRLQEKMDERIIRENIVSRWITGHISEKELIERANFLNLDLDTLFFLPAAIRIFEVEGDEERTVRLSIYELVADILEDTGQGYAARDQKGDLMCIFWSEDEKSLAHESSSIINYIVDEIRSKFRMKAYVLQGTLADDAFCVAEHYRHAIKNFKLKEKIIPENFVVQDQVQISPVTQRIIDYALGHYKEELSLKTLAEKFHGNPAYIGQIFRKDTGKSFADYVKQIRIDRAKELLVQTSLNAKDIGEKTGFLSSTYFSTVFRKETGLSPERYRQEMSNQ